MDFEQTGYKILSSIFIFLLIVPVFSVDVGEGVSEEKGDGVSVNSSYQLIPHTEGVGSGRITFRIEGEAAVEFRNALLDSLSDDEVLEKDELRLYFGESGILNSYVERGDKLERFRENPPFFRYGFKPNRDISPEERLGYQGLKIASVELPDRDISEDTKGLINTSYGDRSLIEIDLRLNFEKEDHLKRREIKYSHNELISVLWDSIMIPADIEYTDDLTREEKFMLRDGIELPHKDLLVHEEEVQGVAVKNGERMSRENYSFEEGGRVTVHEHDNLSLGDSIRFYYAHGVNWPGRSEVTHWKFVLGTDSFRVRSRDEGSLFFLRTPGGHVLRYEYEFEGDENGLVWEGFNVLDNPQILFFLVALLSYASLKGLSYNYHRSKMSEKRWLNIGSKVSCLGLFILYFFPAVGPLFVNGFLLILISSAVSFTIIGLSILVYGRKSGVLFEALYREEEEKAMDGRLLKRSEKKRELKVLRCSHCHTDFSVSKKRSPLTVLCPGCGKRVKRLDVGRNHLLMAEDQKRWGVYSLFVQSLSEGHPGLILSTHEPGEIERNFRVNRDLVVKVTEEAEKGGEIGFTELGSLGIDLVEGFVRDHEDGVVLVEGIDEEFESFLDELLEKIEGEDVTLLIQLDPERVSEDVVEKIKKKVDRYEKL